MKIFKTVLLSLLACFMCSSCISLRDRPGERAENLITKERADQLHETYLTNQYAYINNDLPGDAVDNVGALLTNVEDLQLFLESIIALKKRDTISTVGMYVYFGADTISPNVTKSTVFFEAAYVPKSKSAKSPGGASFAPANMVVMPPDASYISVGDEFSYYDKLHPVGTRKTKGGN